MAGKTKKDELLEHIIRNSMFAADNAYMDTARRPGGATNAQLTKAAVSAAIKNAIHNDLLRVSPNAESRCEGWLCMQDCGESHVDE